jgi:hypothetical protein
MLQAAPTSAFSSSGGKFHWLGPTAFRDRMHVPMPYVAISTVIPQAHQPRILEAIPVHDRKFLNLDIRELEPLPFDVIFDIALVKLSLKMAHGICFDPMHQHDIFM